MIALDHFDRDPPRLVLFDLDDTLADYATARRRRLGHAFRSQLTHLSEPDVDALLPSLIATSIARSPHGTDHFADLLAAHGVSQAAANAAAQWYRTNRFAHLALFPSAVTVVNTIRSAVAGRMVGIITNGPAAVQREKVELLGIDSLADIVIISGEVGIEKPDPAIFQLALDAAGVTALETVMIGDAPEFDMVGARNAGIRSVWLNQHRIRWPYHDWTPDRTVGELRELVSVLAPQHPNPLTINFTRNTIEESR